MQRFLHGFFCKAREHPYLRLLILNFCWIFCRHYSIFISSLNNNPILFIKECHSNNMGFFPNKVNSASYKQQQSTPVLIPILCFINQSPEGNAIPFANIFANSSIFVFVVHKGNQWFWVSFVDIKSLLHAIKATLLICKMRQVSELISNLPLIHMNFGWVFMEEIITTLKQTYCSK